MAAQMTIRKSPESGFSPRRFAKPIRNQLIAVLLCLGAVLAISANSFAQDYSQIGSESGESSTGETKRTLSHKQIESLLTHMLSSTGNDREGERDQASEQTVSYDQTILNDWEETQSRLKFSDRIKKLIHLLPTYPAELKEAVMKITSPEIGWGLWSVIGILGLILLIGLVFEFITTQKLLKRLYRFVETQEKSLNLKIRFIIARVIIQLIGIAVLGITIYVSSLFLLQPNLYLDVLFNEGLFALIKFRIWMIMLRNIFSPYRDELRPIPMDNRSARQLYLWFTLFFAIIEFGSLPVIYLTTVGMDELMVKGIFIPYTLGLNIIILSQIWSQRHKINRMFNAQTGENSPSEPNHPPYFIKELVANSWPFVFTAWLLFLWALWLFKTFMGHWQHAEFVTISWWITLAFPVVDRIFNGLLCNFVKIESLQSPTFEPRARRFIKVLQTGFRILLFGVAIFMLTRAIGANTESLMEASWLQGMLEKGINFTIIVTITYLVWELFNALIEKKLPTEEFDVIASLEGDGGGEGATRAETLLPLIRSCVTAVLVIFVVLSSLHSLGIAITPLLAGAGVVGIAIGFGAQKLVQDILGGLFFLIDDAFRRGEYIELEGLRGTVEKISLRSMQLRHHLGAVQTVPYGEIKTVSNLSRDWITMKLELRLSYDTDIEAVRKIIKKVGKDMLAHEEYGRNFILPLKSQGVMRVEESALIIRMKFTSKPGEQWVIRREAYRRVRDALSEANIHFAHREVRVLLPENKETSADRTENGTHPLLAGAGGAATALLASELAKQDKIDEGGDDGGGDDR